MTDADSALETLEPECREALEAWLTSDAPSDRSSGPDSAIPAAQRQHLEECPRCRSHQESLRRDRSRIESYFASTFVPSPPRIEIRDPIQAASGYPRRISLTLIPFFLALMLIASLAAIAMGWRVVGEFERERKEYQARSEAILLQVAVRKAQELGVSLNGPVPWAKALYQLGDQTNFLRFTLTGGEPELLDPFAHPYILRLQGGVPRVYSVGPNGIDEGGEGDDITSEG